MRRLVMATAVAGVTLLLLAGAAHAFQCPKLISQIDALASNRFDAAGYEAREKAAQAERLHREGKHAESEKAAKEGLAKLGISL
jgi:hypothetical protein